MKQDLVLWAGPVANYQVPGATVPGAKELFLQCVGKRMPSHGPSVKLCPTIGNSLQGSVGSLLAKAGIAEGDLGDLFFGAFSAGGSVVKRALSNKAYRDATTAVMLSDATYVGGWVDKKKGLAPPIVGFVSYALDIINGPGDKLFVATASPSPNYDNPNGVQVLQAIRRDIEAKTGKKFTRLDDFFGVEPGPESAYQLGNVILAEYPMKPLGHGHTSIAPQTWQKILQPWLKKGKGPLQAPGGLPVVPPVPPSAIDKEPESADWGWLAVGGAVGLAVSLWLARRR
jgi:hypothetical protein